MNIKQTRAALDIFEKYSKNWLAAAEHDQIYADFCAEVIPPDSDDGIALKKLGWHLEDHCWSIYV